MGKLGRGLSFCTVKRHTNNCYTPRILLSKSKIFYSSGSKSLQRSSFVTLYFCSHLGTLIADGMVKRQLAVLLNV